MFLTGRFIIPLLFTTHLAIPFPRIHIPCAFHIIFDQWVLVWKSLQTFVALMYVPRPRFNVQVSANNSCAQGTDARKMPGCNRGKEKDGWSKNALREKYFVKHKLLHHTHQSDTQKPSWVTILPDSGSLETNLGFDMAQEKRGMSKYDTTWPCRRCSRGR